MDGTPRLRTGAWPNTPQTVHRRSNAPAATSPTGGSGRRLPDISTLKKTAAAGSSSPASTEPLIPLDVVDAATQRLLVVAFYIALWFWRLWNFFNLLRTGENESLWLFMKWMFIDSMFLFGLPALRIPWLEFSSPSITVIFLAHVFFNACLMFQIGLPVRAWIWALVKLLYDRETGVSDRRVKPADFLRDDELLSGRHILHILPEGYVAVHYMMVRIGRLIGCAGRHTSIHSETRSASAAHTAQSTYPFRSTRRYQYQWSYYGKISRRKRRTFCRSRTPC
jgi:nucleoporin POM152